MASRIDQLISQLERKAEQIAEAEDQESLIGAEITELQEESADLAKRLAMAKAALKKAKSAIKGLEADYDELERVIRQLDPKFSGL